MFSGIQAATATPLFTALSGSTDSDVPTAECGPGSSPEHGVQGQVPAEDRHNGRSAEGYHCNMELLGRYQGTGASWVNPSYRDCAYMATSISGVGQLRGGLQGVQVVDVSDPDQPRKAGSLTSPAMATDPWESLKVNEKRGLLAAVSGGSAVGGLFFDVYDIGDDCTKPTLLNSFSDSKLTLPANTLGHEGEFSPDGRTYWASGAVAGSLTAIDVADPSRPKVVWTGAAGLPINHGFSFSDDGNRIYLATGFPAGLVTLDVSDVQRRAAVPHVREVNRIAWNAGGYSQQTIPVTYDGIPHLITVDEFASEGIRVFDLSDERHPKLVRHLQLQIQQSDNVDKRRADTARSGLFGYESHYCGVDRATDPGALACGYFQSGIRVFDIADPEQPREVAYFNPPGQADRKARLTGSEHANHVAVGAVPPVSDVVHGNVGGLLGERLSSDLSTDWCSSPPRFVGPDQLWVTCQDNGFLALRFTNGVRPGSAG